MAKVRNPKPKTGSVNTGFYEWNTVSGMVTERAYSPIEHLSIDEYLARRAVEDAIEEQVEKRPVVKVVSYDNREPSRLNI